MFAHDHDVLSKEPLSMREISDRRNVEAYVVSWKIHRQNTIKPTANGFS